MDKNMRVETLLEGPYYLIDSFPAQVPRERGAYYLEAADWLREDRRAFTDKLTRILVKLGCFLPFALWTGTWQEEPHPAALARAIRENRDTLYVLAQDDTLIALADDDLHATVYSGTIQTLTLLADLARGEGLFWRGGASSEP